MHAGVGLLPLRASAAVGSGSAVSVLRASPGQLVQESLRADPTPGVPKQLLNICADSVRTLGAEAGVQKPGCRSRGAEAGVQKPGCESKPSALSLLGGK